LPADILDQINNTFVDIFQHIMCFISTTEKNNKLLEPSVRLLGDYIAEETGALRSELTNVLPHVIAVIKESSDTTLLEHFLPAFMEIAADDDLRTIFLENSGHVIVVEYFKKNATQLLDNSLREDTESYETLTYCINVLLNCLYLEQIMKQRVGIACVGALPTAIMCVNVFVHINNPQQSQFRLWAHFVAFTFATLQQFSQSTLVVPDKQNMVEWLEAAFTNLLRFFEWVSPNLQSTESYWNNLGELWIISMNVVSECLPKYPILYKNWNSKKHEISTIYKDEIKIVLEKLQTKKHQAANHK